MKMLSNVKRLTRRLAAGAAVTLAAVAGFTAYNFHAAAADLTLNSSKKDCDTNAVIVCGVPSLRQLKKAVKDGAKATVNGQVITDSAASIQNIYGFFHISVSDINNMSSENTVIGTVTKTGKVLIGNEVVATDAVTAGRLNIPGSTPEPNKEHPTFYKRPTSVSFKEVSLPAFVVMQDGKFQFAILGPCGNSVVGKPKLPNYSIQKQVRVKGDKTWQSNVTVTSGMHVEYRIRVTSTGAISAKNIVVTDHKPGNLIYVQGSLKRDGASINVGDFFGSKGNLIKNLAVGESVDYTFEAIAGPAPTSPRCSEQPVENTGTINSPGLKSKSSSATVTERCKSPQLKYACIDLVGTSTTQDPNEYKFVATTQQSKSISIKSADFTFGDGAFAKSVKPASITTVATKHTYATAGTYHISATVSFNVGSAVKTADCKTTIQIPFGQCENLTPTLLDTAMNKYQFVANTNQGNGETLTGADFDFGDGTPQQTNVAPSSAKTVTVDHTFAIPAAKTKYTIMAVVHFSVGGVIKNDNCQTQITITPPPSSFQQCLSLTPEITDEQTRTVQFTVTTNQDSTSTLTGADFDFGDNQSDKNVAPASDKTVVDTHSYETAGSYIVTATVHFNTPDGVKDIDCTTNVNFGPTCDELSITQGGGREIEASVSFTANGATLKKVIYNFGDGSPLMRTPNTDVTYTYAKDGNYTVTAALRFMLANGQTQIVNSDNCAKPVSFTSQPTCTAPNGQTFPAGSQECTSTCTASSGQTFPAGSVQCRPTCTAPNGQVFPAGSKQCMPPPATLVNTGPSSMLGMFAGVSAAGAIIHRLFLRRRAMFEAK